MVREGDQEDVALNGHVYQIVLERLERKPPRPATKG
jgi:hypothetical protein